MDRSRNLSTVSLLVEPLEARRLLAAPWGAFPQLIGLDAAARDFPSIDGRGQSIAVIDTGVNWRHPALGAGFGPGHKVVGGWDFVDNDPDPMDTDGHGTGVAGIIAADEFTYAGQLHRGIAPGVNIVAIRVDDDNSDQDTYRNHVEAALQWIIAHRQEYNIVAVNMSFGDGQYSSPTSRPPYGDELATLARANVFLSAVTGNDGVQSPPAILYPGADPNVFAVGSVNASDVISTFTQRSANLDLLAPGENVPTPYYDPVQDRTIYLAATGTSFASPAVAAAAALIRQVKPDLSPREILKILQDSGSPNLDGDNESGSTTGLTFRRLNLRNALAMAIEQPARNDHYENNNSRKTATPLRLKSKAVTLTGLRLPDGDNDYYAFQLSSPQSVRIHVTAAKSDRPAAGQLLNHAGRKIAWLDPGTTTRSLVAGTYYLRFSASSSLPDTYAVRLSLARAGSKHDPMRPQSVAGRFKLRGGILSIAGNAGNDEISVHFDRKHAVYRASLNGSTRVFAKNALKAITVNSRGGNDRVILSPAVKIPSTILGSAGDDTLAGGSGDDRIEGRAGNDFLRGNAGNDALYGHDGDDTLRGGSGTNTLVDDIGEAL